MDVAEMKLAGTTTAPNQRNAAAKGQKAKGHALATLCVNFAREEVAAEEKRGEKRMGFVARIKDLTKEGHAEFRAELRRELLSFTDAEQTLVNEHAMEEAESTKGGYSATSFRVMVSCWTTISVACEAGLEVKNEDGTAKKWDAVLSDARALRKVQTSNGTATTSEGQRKQGAGRKQANPYDKAWALVTKLERKDQLRMLHALAAGLKMNVSPQEKAPRAAGRKAASTDAAVLH